MAEAFDIEDFPTDETALEMLHMVSEDFYAKSYVGKWLFQVMGIEWHDIKNKVEELSDQFFIETATWGLKWHEIKWQLPKREYLSDEERRKILLQKRDYRAPMTPYRLEQMIDDISGGLAHIEDIHDPGINGYIPSHPNIFRVVIENGNEIIDATEIFKRIDEVKQSHTVYRVDMITAVGVEIGISTSYCKVFYRPCGTYPKTSRGLGLVTEKIDITTTSGVIKQKPLLSGESGKAGLFPEMSTRLKIADDVAEIEAYGIGMLSRYIPSGEGDTGQYPVTSRGAEKSTDSVEQKVIAENFRVTYPFCGSAFEI